MALMRSGKKKGRAGGGLYTGSPGPRAGFSSPQRMKLLLVLLAFVVLVALVTRQVAPVSRAPEYAMETEGYAAETVTAPIPFKAVDLKATRLKKDEAAAMVPLSYTVDHERVEAQLQAYAERVRRLAEFRGAVDEVVREALKGSTSDQTTEEVVASAVRGVADGIVGQAPFEDIVEPGHLTPWLLPTPESIPERVYAASDPAAGAGEAGPAAAGPVAVTKLKDPETTPLAFADAGRIAELGRKGLEYALNYGLFDAGALAAQARRETGGEGAVSEVVILRERPVGDQPRSEQLPVAEAPVEATARRLLREQIAAASREMAGEAGDTTENWLELEEAAFQVALACLDETLVYDALTTDDQRRSTRDRVPDEMKEIERNQVIQERGYPWNEQSRVEYETLAGLMTSGQDQASTFLRVFLANMILVGLALACLTRTLALLNPEHGEAAFRNLCLVLLVMCAVLAIGRVVAHVYDSPSAGYLVPAAAGAILLAILLNTRTAALASLLIAGLLSVQYKYDWRLLVVSAVMSFAGLLSIYKVRKRSDMGRAAVKATALGALAAVAVTLGTGSLSSLVTFSGNSLLLVALNGVACLFLVPGLLPPLERLFGMTTDITLLEYSDLNNEVLGRLAIEVPATYAHGLMLGQIAEAACEAIGANGLLARVCSYYHDIGKLRRPEYFAENQEGVNIHDGLSPRLSARAIASHVMEGAEMAREFHLPKPIVDGIYEHHGTCKISFFYDQAVAQQRHGDVREEDYRYPGPKPQSRETAILMVCDAVESAVRSLKNPNEERVRELVDKIVASRADDRQFDECDLTLRDLDTVASVVSKRVLSSLHRRIAYPDQEPEKGASNVIPLSGGQDS